MILGNFDSTFAAHPEMALYIPLIGGTGGNVGRTLTKMNKKLLRSVREYKKQSVLAPILVILEVLMEVLIPLEMAKIIDVGIANGDMSYIDVYKRQAIRKRRQSI